MFNKKIVPPETLVYTGMSTNETEIYHLQYNSDSVKETTTVESKDKMKSWIMIKGLSNVELLSKILLDFHVDPLVIEDILNIHQRNKIEIYDDYVFSVKRFSFIEGNDIKHSYISILLFEDKLITFQEEDNQLFDPLIIRIKNHKGIITRLSHDYLYYAIQDTIVDYNIITRRYISEEILKLENEVTVLQSTEQLELYFLRKELMVLKNSNREMLFSFSHQEYKKTNLISEEIYKYYEDLYDHITRLDENITMEQELLANLLDVQMNITSSKTNRVMTILTIFSAIFIPLSFFAGVFGMNFNYFPFLQNENGMIYFIGMCFVVSIGMLSYFKFKKWI